jgi:hypothetical protein
MQAHKSVKNIVVSVIIVLLFFTLGYSAFKKPVIFFAHLHGWYPTDPQELSETLYDLDFQARLIFPSDMPTAPVRAMIVPHAGYHYSGDIAASAYQRLNRTLIKRIVVLAPSHQVPFAGIALPEFDQYKTAIGSISIDQTMVQKLANNPLFSYNNGVYQTEHSFEMQVPFIIAYLPHIPVIPLIVGTMTPEQIDEIATMLAPYITKQTLVIVSSDFTHYGPRFNYTPFTDHISQRVTQLDSGALQTIQNFSLNQFLSYVDQTGATICGRNAIAVLLALIEKNALGAVTPELIAYKTSAQITTEQDDSVSYVSMIFCATQAKNVDAPTLNAYEKRALLTLARDTLSASTQATADTLKKNIPDDLLLPIKTKENTAARGAFVTLYKKGALRGCIGRITSDKPLYQTVIDMTKAAAFEDSRFSPVTADELNDITITISVLTPAKPIASYNDIVLGRDGIILTNGAQSALFLPHVATEFKWDLPTTLTQLSEKAGLNPDAWKNKETTYQTFESIDFSE